MGRRVSVGKAAVLSAVVVGLLGLAWLWGAQVMGVPALSDEAVVEKLFDPRRPGYSDTRVLASAGEGLQKIPRTIQVEVRLESYPESILCAGEVIWDRGGPMVLGITWRTLACAGHSRYIELAQAALQSGGLEQAECHTERLAFLLARWLNMGLIDVDDLPWPETRARVTALAADPRLLTNLAPYDGGLFETQQLVVREDVVPAQPPDNTWHFVLRCEGVLEAFPISLGSLSEYAGLQPGDYILPETLAPAVIR